MAAPPIDIDSAVEYQKLNCESKPEAEREKCYDDKIKEITAAQEKRAVTKAAVGGTVTLIIIALLIVGLYFLIRYIKRRRAAVVKTN